MKLSSQDKRQIKKILTSFEFPTHINHEPLEHIKDILESSYWISLYTYKQCYFCEQPAYYQNTMTQTSACSECYGTIKKCKYNLYHSHRNAVSKTIRRKLINWIDHYYYDLIADWCYFNEYNIEYAQCDICGNFIYLSREDWTGVALFGDGHHVAHQDCAEIYGFPNLLSRKAYDRIIKAFL